jgi:hypothetical protein
MEEERERERQNSGFVVVEPKTEKAGAPEFLSL